MCVIKARSKNSINVQDSKNFINVLFSVHICPLRYLLKKKRLILNESKNNSNNHFSVFHAFFDRNYCILSVCFDFFRKNLIPEFICMIYFLTFSLEIAKKNFVPSIEPNFDPVNLRFGSIVSAIVVAFLCFNLLIAHFLPIGLEKVYPVFFIFVLFFLTSD